jgi:hypothetical protein
VEWIKKSSTMFGVGIEINGQKMGPSTIAEYGTNSEINNPYAFLDWSGEDEGWVEIWYGCPIKEYEVNILSIK